MINGLDPIKYSHHYINLGTSKAVVGDNVYKDEQDAYVASQIRRDKEIRRYFEGNIMPSAANALNKLNSMADYARELYISGVEEGFKTHNNLNDETTLEYETKRKGFKKYTVIRVFENSALKTKIETISGKITTVKDYKNGLTNYDYYEFHPVSGKDIFKENVKEKSDGFSLRTFADKAYTYQGGMLKRYEEGVSSMQIEHSKTITVKKRFEPDYNSFLVKYSENIAKNSPFRRETSEFQSEAPFKRFYEG